MKYIFNYTDNNSAASRGLDRDTFYEEEVSWSGRWRIIKTSADTVKISALHSKS